MDVLLLLVDVVILFIVIIVIVIVVVVGGPVWQLGGEVRVGGVDGSPFHPPVSQSNKKNSFLLVGIIVTWLLIGHCVPPASLAV